MNNIILITTLTLLFSNAYSNSAMESMKKIEAKQKVRMHNDGYMRARDRHVKRRSWRGEECDVSIARTYVEENRREINVYSYIDGDVSVSCD